MLHQSWRFVSTHFELPARRSASLGPIPYRSNASFARGRSYVQPLRCAAQKWLSDVFSNSLISWKFERREDQSRSDRTCQRLEAKYFGLEELHRDLGGLQEKHGETLVMTIYDNVSVLSSHQQPPTFDYQMTEQRWVTVAPLKLARNPNLALPLWHTKAPCFRVDFIDPQGEDGEGKNIFHLTQQNHIKQWPKSNQLDTLQPVQRLANAAQHRQHSSRGLFFRSALVLSKVFLKSHLITIISLLNYFIFLQVKTSRQFIRLRLADNAVPESRLHTDKQNTDIVTSYCWFSAFSLLAAATLALTFMFSNIKFSISWGIRLVQMFTASRSRIQSKPWLSQIAYVQVGAWIQRWLVGELSPQFAWRGLWTARRLPRSISHGSSESWQRE